MAIQSNLEKFALIEIGAPIIEQSEAEKKQQHRVFTKIHGKIQNRSDKLTIDICELINKRLLLILLSNL